MNNIPGKVGLNLGGGGTRGGAQLIQLIQIPKNLQQTAKTLRLNGEITQINARQNTVQIQTQEGSVEVRADTRNVRQGQPVIVEIPAGRPPRQARVAVEPQVNTPRQSNQPTNVPSDNNNQRQTYLTPPRVSPPASSSPRSADAPVTRQTSAPGTIQPQPVQENLPRTIAKLTTAVTEEIAAQIAKVLKQAPQVIRPDTVVKILSATPQQAQTIIAQTLQSLPPPQQATAQNINIQPSLVNTAEGRPQLSVNVPSSPSVQVQPVTIGNGLIQQPTQPLQNLTITPQIQNNIVTLTPNVANSNANVTPIIPNTQIITTSQLLPQQQINLALQAIVNNSAPIANTSQAITSNTPQAVNITAPLQPVLFDPATPQPIQIVSAPKLQTQIVSILPPTPKITPLPNAQRSVQPSQPIIPPVTSAQNATTLPAQVVGFTPRGLPLISLQLPGASTPQYFIAQVRGENLQLGTQLQIMQRGAIAPTPLASQALQSNPLLRGFQWPALDELNLLLQQINPQAASSLSRSLPGASNPTQLTAAAMTFIAAVKSGDIASFLGERKMDLIRQTGRDNILNRLTQGDGARAGGIEPAASGDWRAVPLPMFWEGEIHRIMLYTRQENFNQQNDQDDKKIHTRFIFDLSLSNLGDVQLDGFLKDQRLDLILRTKQSFSDPMQQSMRQAYSSALDQAELSGDLNFQGSLDNWVKVDEEKAAYMTQI